MILGRTFELGAIANLNLEDMMRVYKKYFFTKDKSVDYLKSKFKGNEIVILENTEPLLAIIHHRKKELAAYEHVETRNGINKYLTKKKNYNKLSYKKKDELLDKILKLGKFVLSKNKKMVPGLTKVFFIVLTEILLVLFLLSLPGLWEKRGDFLIILLEIVGTTLTFFFSASVIEPESHGLMLESYDKEVVEEAKNVNQILSLIGFILFIIGFFLQLHNIIA